MKKSSTTSITREELLSSLDIQDWNLKAFAHEICDNIGQILSLAKIRIATLNPEKKEEARQIVNQSDQLLARAIRDLRNLARQLTPTEILHKGFADSVSRELNRLQNAGICATAFSTEGNQFRLDGIRELILYSILNRYIYEALYEEKTKYLAVHISYRSQSISLEMNWQPEADTSWTGPDSKTVRSILKRAKLIHAEVKTAENETGRILHLRIKRNSS